MKIEILLKKDFSLHDWKEAKECIDNYLFEQFSKEKHPSNRAAFCEMSGPHVIHNNDMTKHNWEDGVVYNVKIQHSLNIENAPKKEYYEPTGT